MKQPTPARKPKPRMTPHEPHDGAIRTCGIEYQPYEMAFDARNEGAANWRQRMQRPVTPEPPNDNNAAR